MVREAGWCVQDGHFGDFKHFHVDFPMNQESEEVILEESHIEEPCNDDNGESGDDSKKNGERIH